MDGDNHLSSSKLSACRPLSIKTGDAMRPTLSDAINIVLNYIYNGLESK